MRNNKLGCGLHAWTLYLFTDHFSDARISRMSLSTFMAAIQELTVNKQSASFFWGGATYTRVIQLYCTGAGKPNSNSDILAFRGVTRIQS